MFAYCGNNPIMFTDPDGQMLVSVLNIQKIIDPMVKTTIELLVIKSDEALNYDQMKHNASLVYCYLSYKGWSKQAICATLGNMQYESYINPGKTQYHGDGYGLVQWDPPTKYTNWADDNGYQNDSLVGQLEFLIYSMEVGRGEWFDNPNHPNNYMPSADFIRSTESLYRLTSVFLYSYERPDVYNSNTRAIYALMWYCSFICE